MAEHRHISSTEKYLQDNLENLHEMIETLLPISEFSYLYFLYSKNLPDLLIVMWKAVTIILVYVIILRKFKICI